MSATRNARQLQAIRTILQELRRRQEINISVILWDGSEVPLAKQVTSGLSIRIAGPGVIGAALRRPGLDRLIGLHANGGLDLDGGTLLDVVNVLPDRKARAQARWVSKSLLLRNALPFLTATEWRPTTDLAFEGKPDSTVKSPKANAAPIDFHYSVSNEFYQLFLEKELQYSCAYFTEWSNDLEQAQLDKMEMSCRRLRLKPGERLLDIGCGWGAFMIYAARNYGVHAHGVTLSTKQYEFACENIKKFGLEDQVTIELKDYTLADGSYDKISSIGFYEHVGPTNVDTYLTTVKRLLKRDGLFLNHAITTRSKRRTSRFKRRAPEKRAILKYVFPGHELDRVGEFASSLERNGFEVHDVEDWRQHYALTTKIWCERLHANRERAVTLVGEGRTRMWLAYLAGVSIAFQRGSLLLYQTLASKSGRGESGLPPSRADLYRR